MAHATCMEYFLEMYAAEAVSLPLSEDDDDDDDDGCLGGGVNVQKTMWYTPTVISSEFERQLCD
jgi:hypothetical protein